MKYFLIYWEGDGSDRESYSIFYTTLVIATSESEARDIYISQGHDIDGYSIKEVQPLTK